ncbi:MAG: hypothetical protein ABJ308_08565 [Halieaceae bacterium]
MRASLQLSIKLFAIAVFSAGLLVPAVMTWQEPTGESWENRALATAPALPSSLAGLWALPAAVDDYVLDHFGFRKDLLRTHNRWLIRFGVSPSDKVVLGQNDWLFYEANRLTDQNRGAMPLSQEQLSYYLRQFGARREYMKERGIPYVVLPVPDKHSVYQEQLPAWLRRAGPSRLQQFQGALDAAGEPYVETYKELSAARDRGERVYLKTDSHWSCRGAFLAYQRLMDAVVPMGLDGVHRVTEQEVEFREMARMRGQDLSKNLLLLPDELPETGGVRCKLLEQRAVESVDLRNGRLFERPYQAHQQHLHWRYTNTGYKPRSRVLLYRDSYAQALIPYLINSFDELIVVPRKEMSFDVSLLERYQPDLVIYEFVERALLWAPD